MSSDSSSDNTENKSKIDYRNIIVTLLFGVGIFYFAQLSAVFVLVLVMSLFGRSQEQVESAFGDSHFLQFILIASVATLTTFLIYKFLLFLREKPKEFLMLKNVPNLSQVGEVIITYVVYFVTLIIATILLDQTTSIDINQSQELGINDPTTGISLILVYLSLAVIPPLYEEIMFRGFLFNSLKKYGNVIISYVITSILFGIAHLEYGNLNWIAVVDTLIFSVFLIYISQKHNSLYSSILLHAIKNSIAFFILFVL